MPKEKKSIDHLASLAASEKPAKKTPVKKTTTSKTKKVASVSTTSKKTPVKTAVKEKKETTPKVTKVATKKAVLIKTHDKNLLEEELKPQTETVVADLQKETQQVQEVVLQQHDALSSVPGIIEISKEKKEEEKPKRHKKEYQPKKPHHTKGEKPEPKLKPTHTEVKKEKKQEVAHKQPVVKKVTKKLKVDFNRAKKYSVSEAIELVKQNASAKFLESIDLVIKLNIDPKKSDQQLRGVIEVPHFFGKQKRILVLDKGLKQTHAKEYGVDYCGDSEVLTKINEGWLEFDMIITTPKMMLELSKLGKILGTKGLMPNPKNGNVTTDLKGTIAKFKKGIVQYRNDNTGNLHLVVGKIDSDSSKIKENIDFLLDFILSKKPAVIKGNYLEKVSLSSTMGPSVAIYHTSLANLKNKKTAKNKNASKKNKQVVYFHPKVKYVRKSL